MAKPDLSSQAAGGEIETNYAFPKLRIVVFARAPLLGKVKTRLQAELGAEACLDIYLRLLDRVMRNVLDSRLAPVQLWVDGLPDHEVFLSYCKREHIHLQVQGDLGQRMAGAVENALAEPETEAVLLLGSDCPAMDCSHLQPALSALASGSDAVITPAEDGGYVALGLRSLIPELFVEMDWGGEGVFAATMGRLSALDVKPLVLPALWDVDRPADLKRFLELESR